ncbi:Uncharacterised protein [Mycobacteroides abscessus subsp. abscessus]|nr:Uncharacterised protein [Mycobacteroides abscessus subsp. abscessus]
MPSPVIATSRPPDCSARISASLSSGVASATKWSTPASAAIAFAVSGLSPVTMTVRIPISRSCAKRSVIPGFTTSDSWITPSTRGVSSLTATTSGVPPPFEISATRSVTSTGMSPPSFITHRATASAAPLRYSTTGPGPVRTSIPLIRVSAVKGTTSNSGCS